MSERIDQVIMLEVMETVDEDGEIRVYHPSFKHIADREKKILVEKGRKVRVWVEDIRRG
jgi:hypothetical protein